MPSTHLSLDVLPIIGMTYTPAPFFGPAVMLAILVGLFFAIAFYIWYLWSLSVLFPRIGLPSTHGWIPVWNQWQLVQRGGLPGWLVLFGLIPGLSLVAYVVSVIAIHRLNTEHGKGGGYTVLGALLAPAWAMVLTSAIDAERPGAGYDPAAYPAQGGYAVPGEYAAPAPMYAPPQPVAPQLQAGSEQAGSYAMPEAGSQAFPEPVQPWQQPGEPQRFAPRPDDPQAGAPSVGEPQPPQPGDEWGFSRTTAGHYERLAQEDFQRRQAPLLGAEEPARPFAWPSIEESNPRPVPAAPPAAATPPASPPAAPPAPAAPQQAPPAVVPPVVAPEPSAAGQESDSQESFSTVRPSIFDSNPEQSTDPAPRAATHRAEDEPAEDEFGETVDAPAASAGTVFAESATDAASEEDLDRTVVVPRRSRWGLELPDGEVLELRGDDVVVGRKPLPRNGSAVLQIVDPTRTLSKSHARLRRVDETWTIEDLDSTNGVALVDEHGDQLPLEVNREAPVTERLVIGTLEVTLRRLG